MHDGWGFLTVTALLALVCLAAAPSVANRVSASEDGVTAQQTINDPAPGAARVLDPASPADCLRSSWTAGIVDLCEGSLVYYDYVYDDYGAYDPVRTLTAPTTGTLSQPAGAERYPEGAEATADLVRLELRIEGDRLHAAFEVNALFEPDQTIAALAIDTDSDPVTGGGEWDDLGVSSDGWDVLAVFTDGDPETNLVTGSIPLPPGETWRVQAVAAQADGTVMNVAFRGTDEETDVGAWFEDRQAMALADGDITAFGHLVDVSDLRTATTRLAELPTGYQSRVYTSDYTLPPGEGMSYSDPHVGRHGDSGEVCEQAFHFFGRYQPYGVYVPESDGEPYGLQLALHGCNANHSSLVEQPGMQARFGDDLNRIVVVPLGRGPVGYYSDISERDVLDVMADVKATYDVNEDRVFAGGYSMGGYGALRFGALYPETFAGLVNWVGFTGDGQNNPAIDVPAEYTSGAIGNVIDLVGNLLHVPGAHLYGGADELVHAHTAAALQQRLEASGVPYEWFFHPTAEHFTFALADGWEKESDYTAELTRVTDPARVVYRTDRWLDYPEYGIVHDGAYWIADVEPHEDGYADVDALSEGCPSQPTYATGNDAGVGPLVVAWVSDYREIDGSALLSGENRLTLEVANVASLTVDVAGACLSADPISWTVETDGPVTVTFADGRQIVIGEAGTHEGRTAAATDGDGEETAAPDPVLPATGGGAGILLLAILALLGATAGSRLR